MKRATKTRRGPGRPPLPAGTRKASLLHLRLTDAEGRQVAAAASATGMTVSAWCREVLLTASGGGWVLLRGVPGKENGR